MKGNTKKLVGSVILIVVIVYFARVWHLYSNVSIPPPQRIMNIYLPANAEVDSFDKIRPGTFKKEVSLQQFKNIVVQSDYKPLVSYMDFEGFYYGNTGKIKLEYWISRGDGIFYHCTDTILHPLSSPFLKWEMGYEKNMFTVTAQKNTKFLVVIEMYLIFIGYLVILLLLGKSKNTQQV